MLGSLLLLTALLLGAVRVEGGCHNNCNRNGLCSETSVCECFTGFEGNDCSRRSCPTGNAMGVMPYDTDLGHQKAECSGRGSCNYELGLCKCDPGFAGTSCERLECMNQCSGHGECMSLRNAAKFNDGFLYNRTTSYNLWDADMMYGCKCDHGYGGADCSMKMCDSGVDPRRYDSNPRETVTFVCECPTTGCDGKFKLSFKGKPFKKFFKHDAIARDVADALMNLPGVAANNSLYGPPAIEALSGGNADNQVCNAESTTYTTISFRRYAHDVPSMAIYANLLTVGNVYFDTFQTINCDCIQRNCNGTFRLLFDGAVTDSMVSYINRTLIPHHLRLLDTVRASTIKDIDFVNSSLSDGAESICQPGKLVSNVYRIRSTVSGNLPRLGLWASVGTDTDGDMKTPYYDVSGIGAYSTKYYSTSDFDDDRVMYLTTNDGRDDNFDICNGIGQCDFTTGHCQCPMGWGFHIDRGPCGRMMLSTSSSNGAARCPGTVRRQYDNGGVFHTSRDSERSRAARMYFSTNRGSNGALSRIVVADYVSSPVPKVQSVLYESADKHFTGRPLFNLTSSASAGPVAYDAARERIFFVDQNNGDFFIGKASVADNVTQNWDYFHTDGVERAAMTYDRWLPLDSSRGEVFSLHIDPDPQQRKIYWTIPGIEGYQDGTISWAYLDDDEAPGVHNMGDVIEGTNHKVVDPKGMAIHPYENSLYWVDVDILVDFGNSVPCLRRCRFNEARTSCKDVKEIYFNAQIGNHSTSISTSKMTDLVIDFHHNNTAIVMDAGTPPAILAIPLDAYDTVSPYTLIDTQIKTDTKTYAQRTVAYGEPLIGGASQLKYLVADDRDNFVLWSDSGSINYAYLESRDEVTHSSGLLAYLDGGNQTAYDGTIFTDQPVGLALDMGFGRGFDDGDYLECHGNGVCRGYENNFRCECFDGFTGDCSMRACPKGKAWFHEPLVDDVAHDVDMECSNMGLCDRRRGLCLCKEGFEGEACQRMTCRGRTPTENTCGGNGWCRSLKELSHLRKNGDVEYVNSDELASVYGTKEWDVETWDADSIHGCVGDDYGYYPDTQSPLHNITSAAFWNQGGPEEGSDIRNAGNMECAYGLDIREYEIYLKNGSWPTPDPGDFNANHTIARNRVACTADAGTFTLNFRNQTTVAIAYDATPETAATALEALTTIGEVKITLDPSSSENSAVCSATDTDNHYFMVWFLTERGLVPDLNIAVDSVTHSSATKVLAVSERIEGMGTVKECSGKGECNRATGLCECWPHWGSSDGYGNIGVRNDCGFSTIA